MRKLFANLLASFIPVRRWRQAARRLVLQQIPPSRVTLPVTRKRYSRKISELAKEERTIEVSMQIHQITPVGWRLGLDSPYRRKPKRPEKLQDDAFRQQFDYTTVFYDVFFSPDEEYVVCICPPFFNLKPYIRGSLFFAATSEAPDKLLSCATSIVNHDRCAEIWMGLPPGESDSLICRSPLGTFHTRIGKNYCRLFAGKRVLVTKQKNNKPEWIADWININKALHGVNAVLLFDNGSTIYSRNELAQYLAGCVSLDILAIVDWPYLFGPQGVGGTLPWDSDFTQYAILQVAHWRFLAQAEAVLQQDIDEIMIANDFRDIISEAAATTGGVLLTSTSSHFVVPVTDNGINVGLPSASGSPGNRGSDFYRDTFALVDERSALKYVYIPSSILFGDQLRIHSVCKADGSLLAPPSSNVTLYHFARVNSTDWRVQSRLTTLTHPYNPPKHYFECILVKALNKAEKNMPGYDYPLEGILTFAKTIGACPHPEEASPPRCPATDCSICPYNI